MAAGAGALPRGGAGRNAVAYSAAISAGEKARRWLRALGLLYAVGQAKMERSTVTYSAAISACEKARQ